MRACVRYKRIRCLEYSLEGSPSHIHCIGKVVLVHKLYDNDTTIITEVSNAKLSKGKLGLRTCLFSNLKLTDLYKIKVAIRGLVSTHQGAIVSPVRAQC